MSAEDRIGRAKIVYERAVFSGDASALTDAERGLDAVDADAALARGRILHARFLNERDSTGSAPVEDPAELPLFQRAAELYRALGDVRGEAEAVFWIGCLHQVIRRDNATAAQGRRADALATLDEAHAIAEAHAAHAVVRHIERARTEI